MEFSISLPQWLIEQWQQAPKVITSLEQKMDYVIELARLNIEHDTGGPFAAAVFEEQTGKLVSVGVNRVMPTHCSSAHAEVVALSLAQKQLQNWDLSASSLPKHQLVVNWSPCIMCFGAVIWSGVTSLVVAGSDEEMMKITGFDEGPSIPHWEQELAQRRISVTNNVRREQALEVFQQFATSGCHVYNANH